MRQLLSTSQATRMQHMSKSRATLKQHMSNSCVRCVCVCVCVCVCLGGCVCVCASGLQVKGNWQVKCYTDEYGVNRKCKVTCHQKSEKFVASQW